MVHRILVPIAIACSALVLVSFALFARDQLAGASKHQQTELAAGTPVTPGTLPAVPHRVSQPRRFIDGAATALESPFATVVQSGNQWTLRAVPTMLALLLYGIGLGYLARYSRGLS